MSRPKYFSKKQEKKTIEIINTFSKLTIDDKNDNNKKSKLVTKATGKRVILYLNNDPAKPVTAAGALLYKNVSGKMKILLMENKGKYEDIGGKIDPDDKSIYDAAGREIEEETNGIISKESIIDRLKESQYIYVPKSKYVVFIVEADKNEKKLTKDDFGDKELYDDFKRTIGWFLKNDIIKSSIIQFKMNWRIRNKDLFDKLNIIEHKFKYKKKIF